MKDNIAAKKYSKSGVNDEGSFSEDEDFIE